ncbi:hypothetical protein Pst134EB_005679 [Puccinia striiformis f. sp. tritici]|nr:hypothetical protein Pst134EB_005679 [Puccinia striiformis f. sp. tritici]
MSFPIIHSTGSVPDQGSMIFPQVAAAARDAGQPTETLASPPAIDHTTNLSIGRNANVTGTNARTTTEASDIVMVDIGALTIQHNVQANNVDAPGNIVSTPIRNARVSFVEDLEEELPPAYEEHAPANSRRLPYVLDTPPPARRTRWIGRDSYRPRAPSKTILEKLPILIAALGHPPRAFVVHPTDLLQWLVTVLKRLTVVHSRLRPPGPTCLVPPLVLVLHPVHYPRSQPLPE